MANSILTLQKPEAAPLPTEYISATSETRTQTLQRFASETAEYNGLNPYVFDLIISHESQWNPHAISKTHDYGIAQINLHYHPDVSKIEAENPQWALVWMATEWKQGRESEWSTYRAYVKSLQ